jgi:hypothetical protein
MMRRSRIMKTIKSNSTLFLIKNRTRNRTLSPNSSAAFREIGHPIVGDTKYGAKEALPDQIY